MPRGAKVRGRDVDAILDAIVRGERVIDDWNADMHAAPTYPRDDLVQRLRELGPGAASALRRRLLRSRDDREKAWVAKVIGELAPEQGGLLVDALLSTAASGPFIVREAAAGAAARFAPAQALAAGLHRVPELCYSVLRALGDRPEAVQAAVEALGIEDRHTKVRALQGLDPRLLAEAKVLAAIAASLRHADGSVAASAARVVLAAPNEAALGAVIDAADEQPALLTKQVALAVLGHPRQEEFVTAILQHLRGDLDLREQMALSALDVMLGTERGDRSWTRETRALLSERLAVCVSRKLRPGGSQAKRLAIQASARVADPSFIPAWLDALDEPEGLDGSTLSALGDALSAAGPPALEALERFAANPPSESAARHAPRVLARARGEARGPARASPAAGAVAAHTTAILVRCPRCGSTRAESVEEVGIELDRMKCHACGHEQLCDELQIKDQWNERTAGGGRAHLLPNVRFRALWRALGAERSAAETLARLRAAYDEPHRAYHTAAHLGACFGLLDDPAVRAPAERPHEVEAALWFHDVVYDPRASDNETQSARVAEESLRAAGVAADVTGRISDHILATRHHVPRSADGALVVDIDLAILGAAPATYEQFARAIRVEYAWVDDAAFALARAGVLRGLLDRPSIFATAVLRDRLEARARDNLAAELERLAR